MLMHARTGQALKVTGLQEATFRSQLLGKDLRVEKFRIDGIGQVGLFRIADREKGAVGFSELNLPVLLAETKGRRLTASELKDLLETGVLGTTFPSSKGLILRSSELICQNHRGATITEMEMVNGKPTVRFGVDGHKVSVSFEETAKTRQHPSLESFSFVSPGLGRDSSTSSGSLIVQNTDHADVRSAALANEIHQQGRVFYLHLVSATRELPALLQLPDSWEPPPGGITRYSLKQC
jgi:hypothetical protein